MAASAKHVKTILVTGGAGFVDSHACKALSRAGYLPVTFDNLERGHERAVKWGPLEWGDLRTRGDLEQAFATHRPWAVMTPRRADKAASMRPSRHRWRLGHTARGSLRTCSLR
jgi:nucleoside-diphosphate-sugar epimerase